MSSSNVAYRSPYDTHRGPHPGGVALVYVVLFFSSLVVFSILSNGSGYPTPFEAPEKAQQFFLQFPDAIRFSALLQFGAAIPLGIFTAAVTSRLKFLGVNVTGVSIALFGGIAASVFMSVSGLCSWILVQDGIATDIAVMRAVQLLSFGSGGVGHVVALGLLLAGISVPCLMTGYTPRWIAWLGLVLAAVAELSTLSLVAYPFAFLLPVARFGSFVWLIATGFTLAKNKVSHNDPKI